MGRALLPAGTLIKAESSKLWTPLAGRSARPTPDLEINIGAAPDRDPGFSAVTPIRGGCDVPAPAAPWLFIGNSRRLLKDFDKHLAGQLAGLRVLIRRMVRGY